MGQALYRRYRSKNLSELVGQEHITTALGRALKKGTVSHAYLFTGPRGVGKTSVARILAHEINNLPYEDDTNHLDIIEIDAASNRRIDEIRDLRDKVHVAPTSAKYKVYIIDEVHMLTREAFNALLKTLEEPPTHVIFILATTEVHKLPETIISRTQRYAFKPVDFPKVVAHLRSIAEQENIDVEDAALQLIAEHGEGSFRDSISLLDQIRNTGEKVTLETVHQLLGIAPETLLNDLLAAITMRDAPGVVTTLQTLQEQGFEPPMVAKQLGQTLRMQILQGKTALPHQTMLELLTKLVNVPASSDPRASLEIALLDVALADAPPPSAVTPKTAPPAHKAEPKTMPEEAHVKTATQVEPHPSSFQKKVKAEEIETNLPAPPKEASSPAQASASSETRSLDAASWGQILARLKQKHNTLYSLVRTVNPVFGAGELTLECGYAFHKKRLNESRNKQVIADTIREVTSHEPSINFVVVEGVKPATETAAAPPPLPPADEQIHTVAKTPENNETVKTISNIFGGAELLES